MTISFVVPGDPVPKGRPKITTINGSARAYTPSKTRNYEAHVAACGRNAMIGMSVLSGALRMTLCVHLKVPESWSIKKKALAIRGEISPTKKPDLDNLLKAAADGLNGVVYRDDSQITELVVTKKYSIEPRVEVDIAVIGMEA